MPDADADRWLIVGLGNPEDEYGGTRHNVGADAVRVLAEHHRASFSTNKRVRCRTAQVRLGGRRAALVLPQTYMNNSGGPVQSAASWFDVPVERIVAVHDDLDLDLASLRLKQGGGHGGHNGLKDLDRALGSSQYHRVRIGIGRPPGRMPPSDYVLKRFMPAERDEIDVTLEEAADAVETLVTDGLEAAQNRFHRST